VDQTFRKIWGRRQARPLKARQKRLLEELFPQVQISLAQDVHLSPEPFATHWLEIGFGGGEHLAYQAERNPQIGIIGCEPFVNGVASLLGYIEEQQLHNVRIVQDDARLLLEKLPDHSLEKIFVLFPDPWPKKRHQKRRIVNEETVQQFYRLLKPEGWLILATDIEDYAQGMQEAVEHQPGFVLKLEQRTSIHQRPSDWHVTRYEQKGLDHGRHCTYLTYQKQQV
jgi:tRNA (guanine-N7-)-methyltransferase